MLNIASFTLVFVLTVPNTFYRCVGWPIPFKKTSKSMPSIAVRLEPPEDPYPQLSATIQIMERERMRVQEALVSKLEDVFNKMLDESQRAIDESVKKAMTVFEDKQLLDIVVRGAMIPGSSGQQNSETASFRQVMDPQNTSGGTVVQEAQDYNKDLVNAGNAMNLNDLPNGPVELVAIHSHNFDDVKDETIHSSAKVNSISDSFSDGPISQLLEKENSAFEKSTDLGGENLDSTRMLSQTKSTIADYDTSAESKRTNNHDDDLHVTLENGPIDNIMSFIQLKQKALPGGDIMGNMMKVLQNSAAPMVNVEVVDVFEPPDEVEGKLKEIEAKRNDEEGKMFELAAEELSQLVKITAQELDKNIQIQMNPFLVDTKAVGSSISATMRTGIPGLRFFQENLMPNDTTTAQDNENYNLINTTKNQFSFQNKKKYPEVLNHLASSFLQLQTLSTESFLNPEQLNVKIAAPDQSYPTTVELISDMQKKRSATERLERAKILELQLRLMQASGEMIKDALHTSIARILALLGTTSEAIKIQKLFQS